MFTSEDQFMNLFVESPAWTLWLVTGPDGIVVSHFPFATCVFQEIRAEDTGTTRYQI